MESKQTPIKDLSYYKSNAEEDYISTPISVLRYISELENNAQYREKKAVQEALEGERTKIISEALKPLYLMRELREKHGYFGGYDNGAVIEREIKALEERLKHK